MTRPPSLARRLARRLPGPVKRQLRRVVPARRPPAAASSKPSRPTGPTGPAGQPEPPVFGPRAGKRNPLEAYFRANQGRLIHKWVHYFEVYHRHFQRFRGRQVVVLEFGVSQGGSLQMWREYFGPRARIYGVDIEPRCQELADEGTRIFIGDQEDRDFLRRIADEIGPVDVLIEDGGHTMGQQIATFEELYPRMSRNGVFLIEDLHTSYWERYGGGFRRPGTFIEYAKGLSDQLNAWHSREDGLVVDNFTRTTKSMHLYDSIIVFERGAVSRPRHESTGTPSFTRNAAEG